MQTVTMSGLSLFIQTPRKDNLHFTSLVVKRTYFVNNSLKDEAIKFLSISLFFFYYNIFPVGFSI